jgi:two-component system response regulator FixJ
MPSGLVHLIDDDEDVRRALAFLLGTAGLAVTVYESASVFLEKCENFESGCVVSDVRMPGWNCCGSSSKSARGCRSSS